LFLPRGCSVPEILEPICEASLDFSRVPQYWDQWVRLLASVRSGHTSAISILARFGSAARGDPLYEVGVGIGRLLRTVFLVDYFVNPVFRRELLRVLNRGEATNALKRLIYTGRVANYQAKSEDEMQAVADALSLLANIVMALNTTKMQSIFDRWAQRRSSAIPPELIARIASTRTVGINMRAYSACPSSSTPTNCCRHGSLQRSMFWGNKSAPTRPKNADLDQQQKHNYNHRVTRGSPKNTGKYVVFLPSLLEAKMRVPP